MDKEKREIIHKKATELKNLIDRFNRMYEGLAPVRALLICLSLAFTCVFVTIKESWGLILIGALIFCAAIALRMVIQIISFVKAKLGYESEYNLRSRMKRLQEECSHDERDLTPLEFCYLGGGKKRSVCPICYKETVVKITKDEEDEYLNRPRATGCDPSGWPWGD
jgi:hypothetical protein